MKSKEYMKHSLKNDRTDAGYKEFAESLVGDTVNNDHRKLRLVYMALGLSGESGEVTDLIKKTFMYDKKLNVEKVKEECGDMLWYMSNLLHEIGSSFEEVMQMNVDKLNKRYPTGFTEKDALERKDVQLDINDICPGQELISTISRELDGRYLSKGLSYTVISINTEKNTVILTDFPGHNIHIGYFKKKGE